MYCKYNSPLEYRNMYCKYNSSPLIRGNTYPTMLSFGFVTSKVMNGVVRINFI